MNYDPNIHHRRSIRLKGYDYTQPGAYFVTIVADQGKNLFGVVIKEKMNLSPLGEIIRIEWIHSIGIRKEIVLHEDEFVIMPNHIHGIVWIVAEGFDEVRPTEGITLSNTLKPNQSRSLGGFIAGFKASVTSRARRELNITNIWQRNYYEHIVRNEDELKKIWDYIDNNPQKWFEDRYNTSKP
jgi:putative transposase